jgi:hypothetical protein
MKNMSLRVIDLDLVRASQEVRELELRLRAVPVGDAKLAEQLSLSLEQKRRRLRLLKPNRAARV